MSHPVSEDRLLELAYGELSAREARAVEEHVASCDACRTALARIADTRRLMSALPEEEAPPEGERVLLAAAREAARRPAAAPSHRWTSARAWGATAAVAAVLAVGAVSYRLLVLEPGFRRDDPDAVAGGGPYERAAPSPRPPEAPAPPEAPPAPYGAKAAPAEAQRPRGEEPERRALPAPEPAPRRRAAAPASRGDAEAGRTANGPPYAARPPEPSGVREESRPADVAAAEDEAAAAAPPEPARSSRGPAPSAGAAAEAPRAPARAAPAASREEGGAREASAPAVEAVERYEGLRREGRLAGEIQTFPGCEGEAWRKLERDREGRVVKYVREGVVGGRRLRIEHVFGPDGALELATVVDLERPGTPVDADALGLTLPERAEEAAGLPRCDR